VFKVALSLFMADVQKKIGDILMSEYHKVSFFYILFLQIYMVNLTDCFFSSYESLIYVFLFVMQVSIFNVEKAL
jgi:hypothetical protein